MVYLIPEQERKVMSIAEMEAAFDGKWVFTIHNKETPFAAIPVIIADKPYEGSENGIYDDFKNNPQNGIKGHVSFLFACSLEGFIIF